VESVIRRPIVLLRERIDTISESTPPIVLTISL
jgi:hypothetical protein